MTKLVHFSDWHGAFRPLPWADIYICTGDMLKNFPSVYVDDNSIKRLIDPEYEGLMQRRWMIENDSRRRFLGNQEAPVVVVKGNHDFTSLAPLFRGGPVYEIWNPTDVFEVCGLRFGGCRGINYIIGEWADELREPEFNDVVAKIPIDLDVLVTHAPPWGILDKWAMYGDSHLGSPAISRYIQKCCMEGKLPKAHCFGHIHESARLEFKDLYWSNAATTVNELEL